MRFGHGIQIIAAVVALAASGCRTAAPVRPGRAHPVVHSYCSPELTKERVRRVVVLPFEHRSGDVRAADEVTEIFVGEIQKLGAFEVALPPTDRAKAICRGIFDKNGTMDLDSALKAQDELFADAFVTGKITAYKPYDPPSLGMRLRMVSARSGSVLWTADAVFDGSESRVREMAMEHFEQRHDDKESLFGWTIVMISMRRYVQFVSQQILSTLQAS